MFKAKLIDTLEALGVFRLKRYIGRRGPLILMYHRVVDHPLVPGVKPSVFAEHLAFIKRHFRVLPMDQLARELREGATKPRSVALTFDDGHSDFYQNAWPLLRQYDLPASIYVTTGFVDRKTWLWPDRLRYLLMNTKKSVLSVRGIGELSLIPNRVVAVWNQLGDHCLSLDPESRDSFLADVARSAEVEVPSEPESPFAPLSWQQIREMVASGLEVGSHSVSHPILSHLPDKHLEAELSVSYERIVTETGKAPTGICYPNGMAGDTSEHVEHLASQWYDYGLVAYPGEVAKHNLMHLGRWSAPGNSQRLRQILSGMTRNDNQSGEYR